MKIVYWIMLVVLVGAIGYLLLAPTTVPRPVQVGKAPVYGYRVVNTYPHDPQAFSQGLIFQDGVLYESTGLFGQSTVRKVELKTGKVLQQVPINPDYFGEGLTSWETRLVQLTWKNQKALIYNMADLTASGSFSYTGEGWGLTHDSKQLILSDGSHLLRFFDPATFRETGQVPVHEGATPIRDLNELEFVRGSVYANVWHTDRIAIITPETGVVSGWIDLSGLLTHSERSDAEAVLNGIAYDSANDRLFVTGKLWPKLFEIKVDEVPK